MCVGPPNPDSVPEDGKLKSEMMVKDNRRYYLDLKENSRGRFLRVSQTITRGGPRSQVAIPAQGMIEFRDALTDLLDEFSTDEQAYKQDLPEGRHVHVDNKNFYFDIGKKINNTCFIDSYGLPFFFFLQYFQLERNLSINFKI